MARAFRRPGERGQRQEVPRAADEGEEDAHVLGSQGGWRPGLAHGDQAGEARAAALSVRRSFLSVVSELQNIHGVYGAPSPALATVAVGAVTGVSASGAATTIVSGNVTVWGGVLESTIWSVKV